MAHSATQKLKHPFYGAVYSHGALLGEFGFFELAGGYADLICITDVTLAIIPRLALLKLAATRPSILFALHQSSVRKTCEDHHHRRIKCRLVGADASTLLLLEIGRIAGEPNRQGPQLANEHLLMKRSTTVQSFRSLGQQ